MVRSCEVVGESEERRMKRRIRRGILFLMLLWMCALPVKADSMEGAIITRSPDGTAFTTNAGEIQTVHYRKDYEVSTGVKGTLRNPAIGEHWYGVIRGECIPVKAWRVMLPGAICQHDGYPEDNQFHGVSFQRESCFRSYYSGWLPYCADCGELIENNYFYMSEQVARSIGYLDTSQSYYYKCPHCDNLEMAVALSNHECKDISPNRYFVRYHANFGNGYMEKSVHMVNDSTEYEGRNVTPQAHLNLNTYTRVGYEFAGWNTQKDGSGTAYEDGARIYNLSMEENASIILYAQWEKRESVLEIDPNGGHYEGSTAVKRITGEYQSKITLEENLFTPPKGYKVQFDTMGGEAQDIICGTKHFAGWECVQPFHGTFTQGIYCFLGANGAVDRIKAIYEPDAVILPEAVREGYSFGGWFADKEAKIPIGMSGDSYVPAKDITLYASWVELQLVSEDNYLVYNGTGAVNLSWVQKDSKDKIYEVYQKREDEAWQKLESFEETYSNVPMDKTIYFTGSSGQYTVPFSGIYTITLSGASGEDYGGFEGGKGGKVNATVYLEKGERLLYELGGQNGYPNGGSGNLYGTGGGGSVVSTERTGILLAAGGGGGASVASNGGAGGLREHLVSSAQGEDGECGGGGGLQGGVSGMVNIHEHTGECRHLHTGSPEVYGGCYTLPARCDSKDIEYRETGRVFYYGNIDDYGNHIFCVRCGSHECPGHLDIFGMYTCQKCLYQSKYPITQCTAMTSYMLSCEQDESYSCGYEEGQVLGIKAAAGGSNYVNTGYCIDFREETGVHEGDGMLQITAQRVGFLQESEWNGVKARDVNGPNGIEESTVHKTAVDEEEIRISWKQPEDNGTDYYHQIESYHMDTMELMCRSNMTKNTLISGISGYRYSVDSQKITEVGENHAFLEDRSGEPFLIIQIPEEEMYIHIAPQDKAGNMGASIHIPVSKQEVNYWPVRTEKLELKEGVNVLESDEPDTYYVRADGNTPIQIVLKGEILGNAGENYQIDEATYQIALEQSQESGELTLLIPKRWPCAVGNYTYLYEELRKRQAGEMYLLDASFTWAQRYNTCRSVLVKQQFMVPESLDGRKLHITPQVAAQAEEKVYSDSDADIENGIRLIGDGKGPGIEGGEQLETLEHIDYREQDSIKLEFRATDNGSGLAQFYIEVRNLDNGMSAFYEDTDLTGHIEMLIREEDSLFLGDFRIMVYAKDRVGNESIITNQNIGVALEACVTRVLEPHTPVFKKGESGILYIAAWGYVDKVEVVFPQSFHMEEKILCYEIPAALKQEEIPFAVPLNALDGQQVIHVRSYKNGICLEEESQLVTIEVTGSVLDEFRTRLR